MDAALTAVVGAVLDSVIDITDDHLLIWNDTALVIVPDPFPRRKREGCPLIAMIGNFKGFPKLATNPITS